MELFPCSVDNQGRITIPAVWRKSHKVEPGSVVLVTVHDDRLEIQTPEQSLTEAQKMVAAYGRPGRSAVEQLGEERRRAAQREAEEAARFAEDL